MAAIPPRVFILTGPPASGKSTISRALLNRFAKGVHIEVDALREWVVKGMAHPVPEWTEETALQFRLAEETAGDHAARMLDAGFAVAIDHLHGPDPIQRNIVSRISPRPVAKVALLPRLEVALARNHARVKPGFDCRILDPVIAQISREIVPGDSRLKDWIVVDSSDLSVEETVDAILAASDSAQS